MSHHAFWLASFEHQGLMKPRECEVVRLLSGEMRYESYYLVLLNAEWKDLLTVTDCSSHVVLSGRGGFLNLDSVDWIKEVNVFAIADRRIIDEYIDQYDKLIAYTWGAVYPSKEETRKAGFKFDD